MTEQLRTREGDQVLPVDGQENVGEATIQFIRALTGALVNQTLTREVVSDFSARIEIGVKRYGKPLQTFNGRDVLLDEYQELIDATHYAMQDYMERPDARKRMRVTKLVGLVFEVKRDMLERDESASGSTLRATGV